MHSTLYLLQPDEISENLCFSEPKKDLVNLFTLLSKEFKGPNRLIQHKYIRPSSVHFLPNRLATPESTHAPLEDEQTLFIADSSTSSLDIAHFLVGQNIFTPFSSVLCKNQTAGRGQLRRNWSSPVGNIYAALHLPSTPPFSSEIAAPFMGALLANALNSMGFAVKLKWPNDLIVQDHNQIWHKVAGMLLEERDNALIAGIGINLSHSPSTEELRENYFLEAGNLKDLFPNHQLFQDQTLQNCNNLQKHFTSMQNIFQNIADKTFENDSFSHTFNKNINMINLEPLKIWHFWLTLVEKIVLCYRNLIIKADERAIKHFIEENLAFIGENIKIFHPLIKEELDRNISVNVECIKGRVCGINAQGELLLQTRSNIITILGGSFSQGDD